MRKLLESFYEKLFAELERQEAEKKDQEDVEECFGGGMGGVTTTSFSPAVTHSCFPTKKPNKKKK